MPQPLPAATLVNCTAEVESHEGRKIWVKAELTDAPGGSVFATSRALFVIPKPSAEPPKHPFSA